MTDGAGYPVVVTLNEKAVPTLAVYEPALVTAGARSMVSAKCWAVVPAVLVAVMVMANTPVDAGVPAMVAVPPPAAVKVIPAGRAPVSVRVGAGVPTVVTLKENGVPTLAVYEPALVMAGARSVVSVKSWDTVPVLLVAVMVKVWDPTVVGVPETAAVPLAPGTKVTPAGRVPVSVSVGAG